MDFKVGQSVSVDSKIGWDHPSLKNRSGTYKIAGVDVKGEKCLVCFGELVNDSGWGHHEDDVSKYVDDSFKGKNYRFYFVRNEFLKENDMIEKMKGSGKKMASAVGHGIKVGAATEGVNFTYELVCNWLHNQFGISKEKLNDPVNREVILAISVAGLHLGSSMLEGQVPGMDKVQTGCELVIEGKAKDHSAVLISTVAPMLMHISDMMDPDKAMENLTAQAQANFDSGAIHAQLEGLKSGTKEEEDLVADTGNQNTAVA
jgi:hypothetical protein